MPEELLLTFYGDDFTGSTDAMEALERGGVRTVLFLDTPDPDVLDIFPDVEAVGVAGIARSLTPAEMDKALRPALRWLKDRGAAITHYKTCSTFDSSPQVGSIGRAMDIGKSVFGDRTLFLLVGVPRLGRYCAFGNLFARSAIHDHAEVFRLDRHPTMSRHPVTPMTESDLRLHLSSQTEQRIALFDLLRLENEQEAVHSEFAAMCDDDNDAVLIDAVYASHLTTAGRAIWRAATESGPRFVVGSSGVEYALTAHWEAEGLTEIPDRLSAVHAAEQMIVVSGSCSPVSAEQVERAKADGFEEVAVDTPALLSDARRNAHLSALFARAREAVNSGASLIVHVCLGPDDPRLSECRSIMQSKRESRPAGETIAVSVAVLLQELLRASQVRRVVVAGGDTSGHVARKLGILALTMLAPLSPGCPLCRAHVPESSLDGLEIAFKGGQVGKPDFYSSVLYGAH